MIETDSTGAKILARTMTIDSFIIDGISNIEHIRLDIGDINALIAPNGYGKSNVLNAISFGLMYLNANEETNLFHFFHYPAQRLRVQTRGYNTCKLLGSANGTL